MRAEGSQSRTAGPPVTVVMPVYNRERSVGRAVRSILAQSFRDFELIVVDDASTDGTVTAVEDFGDERVRLLRQPRNGGGNAARNRGIEASRGDILCFLDSDDEFLPHKLDYIVRYFSAHPEVEFLIDSYEMVRGEGADARREQRINRVLDGADVETAIYARQLYKSTPALNARREAVLRVGKFDEALRRRQDMDLALRLARGGRCASTDAILWRKHWMADSISAQQDTFMQAMLDICDRHPEYMTNPAFRAGLSRDFARHFLKLVLRGNSKQLVRDLRQFTGSPYRGYGPNLFGRGVAELGLRMLSRVPGGRSRARGAERTAGRPLGGPEAPRGGAE